MDIPIEPFRLKEEKDLFYRIDDPKAYGLIGHLRGDFGSTGKEFHSTWFQGVRNDLNDEGFKIIFDAIINELRRSGGALADRSSMFNYCCPIKESKLDNCYTSLCWGYRILTKNYALYLRCNPELGDYNFNIYCYDKETLFGKLAADRGMPRYCYSFLPTADIEIRIDFGERGYVPHGINGSAESVERKNKELGITPSQVKAMESGSMFGWDVPAADVKSYDENGDVRKNAVVDREVRG